MVGDWIPEGWRFLARMAASLLTAAAFVVASSTPAGAVSAAPAAPTLLRKGTQGPEVLALEARLAGLGYWSGVIDGVFDEETRHAVVAFQKVIGLTRDGVVGPVTQAAIDTAQRPAPRSTQGHVVEIDLTRQVLLIVDNGTVSEIFDVSTGRRAGTTPVGSWAVYRQIDGLRRAPLGLLYRPKYFRGGVAIHGYTSVPARPASHGCVRVTYQAMDRIWADGVMPLGTPVIVYR